MTTDLKTCFLRYQSWTSITTTSTPQLLVLSPGMLGALDLILEMADLHEHGVSVQPLRPGTKLETGNKNFAGAGGAELHGAGGGGTTEQVIFLVRTHEAEALAPQILQQIEVSGAGGGATTYVLAFCPNICESALVVLREGGQSPHFVRELGMLGMFACDDDLVSMEQPSVFSDFHLHNDPTTAYSIAAAVGKFVSVFGGSNSGFLPKVIAVGKSAKYVADVLTSGRFGGCTSSSVAFGGARIAAVPESQRGVPRVLLCGGGEERSGSGENQAAAQAALSAAAAGGADVRNTIGEIIIVDRKVDLASVFCSQFTYEALLDQEFGLSTAGKVLVPQSVVGDLGSVGGGRSGSSPAGSSGLDPATKFQILKTNSDEPLFREIRHSHISRLGPLLHRRTVEMQRIEAEKDQIQSVQDMEAFMVKLKQLTQEKPALSAHVNLAAFFNDKMQSALDDFQVQWKLEDAITSCADTVGKSLAGIEEGLDNGWPLAVVLRLLCLYSTVYGGLPSVRQLESLKRGMCQVFGYEVVGLLNNLEALGMLSAQTKTAEPVPNRFAKALLSSAVSKWAGLKKEFGLVNDNEDEQDVSYAYSGYAPLSARLVQKSAQICSGRDAIGDATALLDGPVCVIEREAVEGGAVVDGGSAGGRSAVTK